MKLFSNKIIRRMSNKKLLLKKLLEYPNLNNNEYISLINKKNKMFNNNYQNIDELNEINSKIDLFLEKDLIINMIKCSHI